VGAEAAMVARREPIEKSPLSHTFKEIRRMPILYVMSKSRIH
jgi:hypothetical protein